MATKKEIFRTVWVQEHHSVGADQGDMKTDGCGEALSLTSCMDDVAH